MFRELRIKRELHKTFLELFEAEKKGRDTFYLNKKIEVLCHELVHSKSRLGRLI